MLESPKQFSKPINNGLIAYVIKARAPFEKNREIKRREPRKTKQNNSFANWKAVNCSEFAWNQVRWINEREKEGNRKLALYWQCID